MRTHQTAAAFLTAFAAASLALGPLGAAEAKWFEAVTATDAVVSNHSQSAATRLLSALATARSLLSQAAGVEPELPVRVLALRNADSLREVVPQYWDRRGVRPDAASYSGPHTAFIALRTDLPLSNQFPLLLHEYVHLLTSRFRPDAPAWLDEGLSEFWGSLVLVNDRVIVGRAPANHLRLLRSQPWLSVDEMTGRLRGQLGANRRQTAMFYAQSWAMVHYLLMASGSGPASFAPPPDISLREIEPLVRSYIAEGKFGEVAVPFKSAPATTATARPISEAQALAERAHMLLFGERADAAPLLARRALVLEPSQALALEVIGTHHFLRNEADLAREWLSKAYRANPNSFSAAIYLALLSASPVEREELLMAAVRSRPQSDLAWQRLLAIYDADGRAASAQKWCSAVTSYLQPWFDPFPVARCWRK